MANLRRYLRKDRIQVRLRSKKKADAIRELGCLLESGPEITDYRRFLSKLFQQEAQMSSGVAEGIALPHYRNGTVVEPVIALGTSTPGIDWGEEEPVHLVVLIGWPEKHAETYQKTVAEIARRLRSEDVRARLLEADGPDQVIEALRGEP